MGERSLPSPRTPALHGVFPMLVTPFRADGEIDLGDLHRLIEFVLGSNVHGLSILGLGGEVGRLTIDERIAISTIVMRDAGTTPVIVGCTAQDTPTSVRLARDAAAHGAAALMVAPPSTPGLGRAELLGHFTAVARAAAPTPIMVQDAPAFVGISLDAAFVRELAAAEPNVTYAKPEGMPAGEWAAVLVEAGLTVFGGQGGLYTMDGLESGATGLIPGCEAGGAFARLLDAWTQGHRDDAWAAYLRLVPLLAFEFQGLDHYIACLKHLLRTYGVLRAEGLRGRPVPLSAVVQRQLRDRAERAGLLPSGVR
jgi:4-hydroxy-tetrahydrodipicolinate synthase